jgi:hypothetical protein
MALVIRWLTSKHYPFALRPSKAREGVDAALPRPAPT